MISGRHDPVTTPADSEQLAAGIPGAQLELLDAAHLASVEQPAAFTALVLEALAGLEDAA